MNAMSLVGKPVQARPFGWNLEKDGVDTPTLEGVPDPVVGTLQMRHVTVEAASIDYDKFTVIDADGEEWAVDGDTVEAMA